MYANSSRYVGLLFMTPALLFVAVFVLYPLGQLVYTSTTDASLLGGGEFVGLENYAKAFSDKGFWRSLWFTVSYTLYITPVLMGLGFLAALLTTENTRLKQFTRGAIFLPVVIGLATSSFIWLWLFDQQVGLFNRLLVDIGILDKPLVWFRKAELGQLAVIISVTWKIVGFGMILMVAGIQSIGDDLIEAAMIDGASYWQRVRRIILPLAARSILLATLISAIGSMLAFDQFYIMTGGAPRGQTFTSVYWIYQNSFVYFKLGYGSALSLILMVIIMAGAAVQIALTSRKGSS
ncbi:carbohydrate ABC transporter permease [Chelativorans xinjiangense]|uniref:carbohydrate ABC transporter permease n=1 Tax=Chelativorans xinjiangense TaxID=2681485 RepID=UPI00135740F3|nr:sugar ABC transporter permease [Chelativorans xinjiangense]